MFYDLPENVTLEEKCMIPIYDEESLKNLAVQESLLKGKYEWGGMISSVTLN